MKQTKEEFVERISEEKTRRNMLLDREQKALVWRHREKHIRRKARKGKYR